MCLVGFHRLMAFLVTFDGIPSHCFSEDNIIDRTNLTLRCRLPSRDVRHVDLECSGTGRWGAKCVEHFADKTKPARSWSCFIDDPEVRSSVNAAFDALESPGSVEWEYLQPEYGYLHVSPERDKDVYAACVAVFAAVGFNE